MPRTREDIISVLGSAGEMLIAESSPPALPSMNFGKLGLGQHRGSAEGRATTAAWNARR